jgi:hypothetical protein
LADRGVHRCVLVVVVTVIVAADPERTATRCSATAARTDRACAKS